MQDAKNIKSESMDVEAKAPESNSSNTNNANRSKKSMGFLSSLSQLSQLSNTSLNRTKLYYVTGEFLQQCMQVIEENKRLETQIVELQQENQFFVQKMLPNLPKKTKISNKNNNSPSDLLDLSAPDLVQALVSELREPRKDQNNANSINNSNNIDINTQNLNINNRSDEPSNVGNNPDELSSNPHALLSNIPINSSQTPPPLEPESDHGNDDNFGL